MNARFCSNLLLVAAVGCTAIGSLASLSWAQEADYRLYKEIEPKQKIVGPLIGDVTDTTARIWAYAGPRKSQLVLEIAELRSESDASDNKPFSAQLTQTPDAGKHHEVEFFVEGLRPRTKYGFVIRVSDDKQAIAPGQFTTAPPPGKGSRFRLSVASCFGATYARRDGRTRPENAYVTKSWHLLMKRRPDVQLIIGDNVYANSTDYNHLWDSHVLERVNNRPFAQAIRTMPTYAVWDDHDYGPNDSDGTAKGKEQSLRAFGEVYANPPRRGSDAPGVFTKFGWGGVDFFLLDGRYHRTPNDAPNDEAKRYLGDAQFEWLVAQLKVSKAPFKLLVNGSTWKTSRTDSWRTFNFERKRLWRAIVDNNTEGVVFVSGDIHRCALPMHSAEVEGAYRMPEIISSGLGSHGENDMHGFVIVDFDTTREDPLLTARVINGDDEEILMRRVRASDLKLPQPEEE